MCIFLVRETQGSIFRRGPKWHNIPQVKGIELGRMMGLEFTVNVIVNELTIIPMS